MNYKNAILSVIVLFFFLENIFGQMEITNPRAMAEWEEIQGITFIEGENKLSNNMSELEKETKKGRRKLFTDITKAAVNEGITVYVLEKQGNGFREHCIAQGVPESKIISLNYSIDDYPVIGWMRDEGQFTIYNNQVDEMFFAAWGGDAGAKRVADYFKIPFYIENKFDNGYVDGGNFLTDGHGRLFADSFDLDGGKPTNIIIDHYKEKMGINEIINLPSTMVHIDYYMKLINEETFVVADIPESNYNDIDPEEERGFNIKIQDAIDYIKENYVSCYGRPYKFVKITSPPSVNNHALNIGEQTSATSYTNSLFLNKTVIVPTYDSLILGNTNGFAELDRKAIETYQKLLPGYRVIGVPHRYGYMGGSIHCLTRAIGVNEPIFISHAWLPDTVQHSDNNFKIKATIKTKTSVKKAELFWATEPSLNYTSVQMTKAGQDTFVANIPKQAVGAKVHYYIHAESNGGKISRKPMVAPKGTFTFYVSDGTTAVVENKSQLPNIFKLIQNYPNPFNPTTIIKYQIPNIKNQINSNSQIVSLKVYDVLGKEIATLVNKEQTPGSYKVQFDASDLPSGIYLYRITYGKFTKTNRMVLLK